MNGEELERYEIVSKAAFDNDVPLLIDAEETWMQDAADDLIEEMMVKYNKEKVIIFGTLQLYRWDRFDYLKKMHQRAKEQGFKIGMKLVRGAYMEKERERAEEMGYPDPIQTSKKHSDDAFDDALRFCIEHHNPQVSCLSHPLQLTNNLLQFQSHPKNEKQN